MTTDEPERITSADIDGLRSETGRLADSVDNLAERQKATDAEVSKKADKATVERLEELEAGRRVNRRIAVAALLLVLAFGGWAVWSNTSRLNERDADTHKRRVADCESIGEVADRIVTPAAAEVITNVEVADRYKAKVAAGVIEVRRGKGYSADCSVIGQPPGGN